MKTHPLFLRANLWLLIALSIVAPAASSLAGRSPRYAVVPLGKLGTEHPYFIPWVINNRGEVVGTSREGTLLYRDGVIHNLGRFDPVWFSTITAINDRGIILGYASAGSNVSFILPRSNPPLPLTEARILPVPHFIAWDINNHGAIVGWAWEPEQQGNRSLIYHRGQITELEGLVPGRFASVRAINNRGQALGDSAVPGDDSLYASHAVIWSDGHIQDLGTLPGYPYSFARDINDHGEAVGHCTDNLSLHRAFLYRRGRMEPLPVPPRGAATYATDINNAGDVIVAAYLEGQGEDTYWLYSDGALHDLKAIVTRATGWPIHWLIAVGINDRGQIAGIAHYHNGPRSSVLQGFILTPHRWRK